MNNFAQHIDSKDRIIIYDEPVSNNFMRITLGLTVELQQITESSIDKTNMKWKGDTYDPWIMPLSHLDGQFNAIAFKLKNYKKYVFWFSPSWLRRCWATEATKFRSLVSRRFREEAKKLCLGGAMTTARSVLSRNYWRGFFCSTSLPLVLDGFEQRIISSLCCPHL